MAMPPTNEKSRPRRSSTGFFLGHIHPAIAEREKGFENCRECLANNAMSLVFHGRV
ncbi:hypothetical protein BH11MYX4_BH11MYX4_05110 [soil metagenome]